MGKRGEGKKSETGSKRLNIKRAQSLGCSSAKLAQGTSFELENEAEEAGKSRRRRQRGMTVAKDKRDQDRGDERSSRSRTR